MADTDQATAASEASTAETPTQETTVDLAAKLKEYETRLAEFSKFDDKVKSLEKEKNDARAESLRWQATYKGLQSQTTQKLQEAAALREQLLNQGQLSKSELSEMKEMLATLASRVMDEDERKDMDSKLRESRLRSENESMKAQLSRPQTPAQEQQPVQQYADPVVQRKEFLDYWYGAGIDPNDPRLDWGESDSHPQEAFRRLTASVMKLRDNPDQAQTNNLVDEMKRQTEEAIAAIKAQQDEWLKNSQQELDVAKEEAKTVARKEGEQRLRKAGADVAGIPANEGRKSLQTQVNEELDENLLYKGPAGSLERKKNVDEYNRRAALIRSKLIPG